MPPTRRRPSAARRSSPSNCAVLPRRARRREPGGRRAAPDRPDLAVWRQQGRDRRDDQQPARGRHALLAGAARPGGGEHADRLRPSPWAGASSRAAARNSHEQHRSPASRHAPTVRREAPAAAEAQPLYAGRQQVYPKRVFGKVRSREVGGARAVPGALLRWCPGCAGIAARACPTRRCWSTWPGAAVLLLDRDLAAGDLLPDRPADPRRLRACSWSRRCSGGCGAASPARRPSGPTCSCGSSAGSRATATPACGSTRPARATPTLDAQGADQARASGC